MTIWSNRELGLLFVAYEMEAPLRVASRLLSRSESAVNKALMRYGIRQLGVKKPGVKRRFPQKGATPTFLEISREIENYGLFQLPFTASYESVENCLGCLLPWPKRGSEKKFKKISQIEENRIKNDRKKAPLWVSMEDVIQDLRQKGEQIWQLKSRNLARKGESYSVSGDFLSTARLLDFANRRRERVGEPIFFVEGVSEF